MTRLLTPAQSRHLHAPERPLSAPWLAVAFAVVAALVVMLVCPWLLEVWR